MNIEDLKEVQVKNNKMISEIHFKEQCSWLRNSKKKKNLEDDFSKEIFYNFEEKNIYLELIEKEIIDIFSCKEFTNKEKKKLYDLTNEAFWKWKFNLTKK